MKRICFVAVTALLMMLGACSSKNVSLEGSWLIETAYGQPVVVVDTAIITFDTQAMQVSGCNGCNRFFGPYSLSEKRVLSLKNLATTMMACPDAVSELEIMRAFNETNTFEVKEKKDKKYLYFYNDKKEEIMSLISVL